MEKFSDQEICPMCNMPKDMCVCDNLISEELQITIYNDKRKWGKVVTLISFEGDHGLDLHDLLKKAKRKVASGGTVRGNEIELMGEHRFRLKKLLIDEGFPEDIISIKE